MKKQKSWVVLLLGMLAVLGMCFGGTRVLAAATDENGNTFANSSMYCWHEKLLDYKELDSLIIRLQNMQVTDLYVNFSDPEKYAASIAKLQSNGIAVYYLTGNKSWYNDYAQLKTEIDKANTFNTKYPSGRLKGIVFDVEPYLDAGYKANVFKGFETYVNNMVKAYTYAKQKNLKFVTVIPYWYDNYSKEASFTTKQQRNAAILLEKLIKNCDRVSVMNYYKTKVVDHILGEFRYAAQNGKEIESIAEFGSGLESQISYYGESDPFAAARSDWKSIQNALPYSKMYFSYHHLKVIEELDPEANAEEPSSRDVYTLEIYPKLWNGSRYASVKSGTVRVVHMETGMVQNAKITGDSSAGYYTTVQVMSDSAYKIYIADNSGEISPAVLQSIKYKDAQSVEHVDVCTDGILYLPGGLKPYTCVTVNME